MMNNKQQKPDRNGEYERNLFQVTPEFWKKFLNAMGVIGTNPMFTTKYQPGTKNPLVGVVEFLQEKENAKKIVLYSPHGYRIDDAFRQYFPDVVSAICPKVAENIDTYDGMEFDAGITEMGLHLSTVLYDEGYSVTFVESLIPRSLIDMNRTRENAVRPSLKTTAEESKIILSQVYDPAIATVKQFVSGADMVLELHSMQPRNFIEDIEIGQTPEAVDRYLHKFNQDLRPAINVFKENCPPIDGFLENLREFAVDLPVLEDVPYHVVPGLHMTPEVLHLAKNGIVIDIRKDYLGAHEEQPTWESVDRMAWILFQALQAMG